VADFAIAVDAGGFARGLGEISRLKTDYLIRGLADLGYQVINLCPSDLSNGAGAIKLLQEKHKVVFISASIQRKEDAKPVFPPYQIVTLKAKNKKAALFDQLRIGFLGLTQGQVMLPSEIDEPELVVADPLLVAQKLVPELRKKCDLVVLLYHGDFKTVEQIMQVPGIDAILIGGGYLQAKAKQKEQSGVPLAAALSMGKYQNIFKLNLNKDKSVQSVERQQIALNESVTSDPAFVRLAEDFEKAAEQLTNRILQKKFPSGK